MHVLTHSKGVFIKTTSRMHNIFGFVGQIESYRGPHLAVCCVCLVYMVDDILSILYLHSNLLRTFLLPKSNNRLALNQAVRLEPLKYGSHFQSKGKMFRALKQTSYHLK